MKIFSKNKNQFSYETMSFSESALEKQLEEGGEKLRQPPCSVDELLTLLDKIENSLSRVDQVPAKSTRTALSPLMKALVADDLLKHSDIDVKVAVASCISEVTRITAPDAPYNDETMKEVFQLIVSAFENLADKSSRSYKKRVWILETVATIRLCVMMLDLECDALVTEMFQIFFRTIRDYQPEIIFSFMARIMSLVLNESEVISTELLTILLSSMKKDNTPIARRLGERVFETCAFKLKPYLVRDIKDLDICLDDYSTVITSCVCEGRTIGQNTEDASKDVAQGACEEDGDPAATNKSLKTKPNPNPNPTVSSNGISETEKEETPKRSIKSSTKNDFKEVGFSPTKEEDHLDETRSKRNRTPGKEYGESLVGSKVKVLWPSDRMFYEGVIDTYDPIEKKHKVSYNDGDQEILNLREEWWEFIEDDARDVEDEADPSERHRKKISKRSADSAVKHDVDEVTPKRKLTGTPTKSGKTHFRKTSGKTVSKSSKPSGSFKILDSNTPKSKSKQDTMKTASKSKEDNTKTAVKAKGKKPEKGGEACVTKFNYSKSITNEQELRNADQLEVLFKNVAVTGENGWAPSQGIDIHDFRKESVVGEQNDKNMKDGLKFDSRFEIIDVDSFSPSSEGEGNIQDNVDKKKRDSKKIGVATKVLKQIDVLLEAIANQSSNFRSNDKPGCSIEEVMKIVKGMTEIVSDTDLYMKAADVLTKRKNREMFVALSEPHTQIMWLKNKKI